MAKTFSLQKQATGRTNTIEALLGPSGMVSGIEIQNGQEGVQYRGPQKSGCWYVLDMTMAKYIGCELGKGDFFVERRTVVIIHKRFEWKSVLCKFVGTDLFGSKQSHRAHAAESWPPDRNRFWRRMESLPGCSTRSIGESRNISLRTCRKLRVEEFSGGCPPKSPYKTGPERMSLGANTADDQWLSLFWNHCGS